MNSQCVLSNSLTEESWICIITEYGLILRISWKTLKVQKSCDRISKTYNQIWKCHNASLMNFSSSFIESWASLEMCSRILNKSRRYWKILTCALYIEDWRIQWCRPDGKYRDIFYSSSPHTKKQQKTKEVQSITCTPSKMKKHCSASW